jgi:transglutaminase-like putative cysteine protease
MEATRRTRWLGAAVSAWGFTALVTTNQMWAGIILIAYVSYLLVVIPGNPLLRIGPRAWLPINALAIAATFAYASYDLGMALVCGTIYLQVQKLATVKGPRDGLWIFLVSFFQVVLAGAITNHLSFIFVLFGFLGLAVFGGEWLTLERMRRHALQISQSLGTLGRALPLNGAGGPKPETPAAAASNGRSYRTAPTHIGLSAGYAAKALAASLVAVMIASALFVSIPRFATKRMILRLRAFDQSMITGFSDEVQAGGLSNIVKDRTVVMRVRVINSGRGGGLPSYLRLRGLALDEFQVNKWKADLTSPLNHTESAHRIEPEEGFPFRFDPETQTRLKITQNMDLTKVLFSPPFARRIGDLPPDDIVYRPRLHTFLLSGQTLGWKDYTVRAYTQPLHQVEKKLAELTARPELLESTASSMSQSERERLTQLPRTFQGKQEMQQLATELTAGQSTPFDKVRRLNRYLRSNYKYSLENGSGRSTYYLRDFLFEDKKGHCEAFAMALAVLCRMNDIPARVVTGFYTTEYNRYSDLFFVRQCHAHTWNEVWIDGYGWVTFDATPPSALEEGSARFAFLASLQQYWDAWTIYWRRYILDFSIVDQMEYLRKALHLGDSVFARLPRINVPLPTDILSGGAANGGMAVAMVLSAGLAGILALQVGVRRWTARRNGSAQRRRVSKCPVEFYSRVLSLLLAEGWRIRLEQTPAEFASRVAAANPALRMIVPVTEIYYRVRFSNESLAAEDRRLVEELMDAIKRQREGQKRISDLAAGTAG